MLLLFCAYDGMRMRERSLGADINIVISHESPLWWKQISFFAKDSSTFKCFKCSHLFDTTFLQYYNDEQRVRCLEKWKKRKKCVRNWMNQSIKRRISTAYFCIYLIFPLVYSCLLVCLVKVFFARLQAHLSEKRYSVD